MIRSLLENCRDKLWLGNISLAPVNDLHPNLGRKTASLSSNDYLLASQECMREGVSLDRQTTGMHQLHVLVD